MPRWLPFRLKPATATSRLARDDRLRVEQLEPRLLLDAGPIVSEFMASNDQTLRDGDGNSSDWIEIHNPTGAAVVLDGWYLSDDAAQPTKWSFPAETPALDPGDYLVVFASNGREDVVNPDNPYVDDAGNIHTSFKLSRNDADQHDDVVLANDLDGPVRIVHSYVDYPEQTRDVSYGTSSATTTSSVLLASDAPARYHVPTFGEDPTGWTAPAYDDSTWADTIGVGEAGLLITEISTGETRFVEIQNVSREAIDAAGWTVLVNDASGGINAVNSVAWSLSDTIDSAAVRYKTDDAGDNYWGRQIDWDLEGPGWAMIIDGAGNVMDFACWGYSETQIASLDVSYAGFAHITVGNQWIGPGAAPGTADPGTTEGFVAFNDHASGGGTHPNATTYAANGTTSGVLKEITDGTDTPVTLTTSHNGVTFESAGAGPGSGTDAYDVFNGYVDFTTASGCSLATSGADNYTHTFSGLETGGQITYGFIGTAIRGGSNYTNRWTLVTINGAESFTLNEDYSVDRVGVITHDEAPGEVAENQVALWTGHNSATDQGFVAAWTDINPGDDGVFSIVSTQYTGSIPVGTGTADGDKGYSLAGIRLEELAPVGPLAVLKRIGDTDGNTATDFIRSLEASRGAENPEMTVPFGQIAPVLTGIGFSDGQPEFDGIIRTDVAGEMKGVNASLWSRMEFWADDLAQLDTLTLRMKYDDGFVAHLNGVEVASRNAPGRNGQPGELAWNSNATAIHPDGQAVVFEDIDVSDYLGLVQQGTNVLAIHGLNVDATDADFLILPNLVAAGTQHIEQYFFDPTPGETNSGGAVVINEIHYDPEDNSKPAEFIELYNNMHHEEDLSGWRLDDAVRYRFPEGTKIPAGGYLVVAQDPATVQAEFGAAALGPWSGRLDNEGETVVLLDESEFVRDEVDYRNHFPWPVAPQGEGSSLELINPALKNDLGGSWRSSGYNYSESRTYLVSSHSPDWHYRKGTSEASNPTDAWRGVDFVEDATWLTGRTSIGYGDGDDTTPLDDMRYNYSSVYLRHSFYIDGPEDVPNALQLRVYVDDGCIVWINGNEVEPRFYVTGGFKAYNHFAQSHEAGWTQVDVSPGVLRVGHNVLAIHALNTSLGSSDFSIDAELIGVESTTAGGPSPGQQNNVWALNAPPQARKVIHDPQQPLSGQAATITAKITDPNGVASADLHYQVVLPGQYVPAYLPLTHSELLADPEQDRTANPDFENPANWTTVAMVDDGTAGDVTAGDDIYTTTIPGQINRTLVRYRITVTDTLGASVLVPYADDPSLNFAYYVYDGVPDYVAGTRSIQGAGHVYNSEMLTSLPVYSLIARAQDMVEMMAYDSAYQVPQTSDQAIRRAYNWQAGFVYDGVVYDHVDMRLRGANGRYHLAGKRSMRIRFNRGSYLQARDEDGQEYATKWRQLVVSKMFGNRQDINYGLAETINNEMWNLVGVPAPDTHWFHFRVVDGAEEVPAGSNAQYYGDFWGMFMAFEPYDVRFLEAHDLPKGNLYKLTNRVTDGKLQQRYQAIDAPVNAEDYNNIRSNLNSGRTEDWLHSYVNYDEWYRYHAVAEAIKHYDYWPGANKNVSWYFEPDDANPMGRLWYLPFDSDASWGPTWNGGEDEAKAAIYGSGGKSAMKIEYRNTIREIRDLIFQPEVIEPWIDRTAAPIEDFWQADYDRWEDAPASAGTHNFNNNTLWWKVADMKKFAFVGGSWPGGSVGAGGQAAYLDQLANAEGDSTSIPYTPSIWSSSPPGFPIDALTFQCTSFGDPQGSSTFAALQWRIGEITNPAAPAYDPNAPWKFEYAAQWESGEITTFDNSIHIPGGTLQIGHTYRVRVRMKDATGRWSHWSAPVELTTGEPLSPVLDELKITEIMYHPAAPTPAELAVNPNFLADDFEYIELRNTGPTTLDLIGFEFGDGVAFEFTADGVTTLAPGEYVVVVRDIQAFTARYSTGIRVAGEYDGGLNNSSERVSLLDPYDRLVLEFTYFDGGDWFNHTDGEGFSLVVRDDAQDPALFNSEDGWQASWAIGGNPGQTDPSPLSPGDLVINEVLAHTDGPMGDRIELHNTTGSPINITGWFLSDDRLQLDKYQITTPTTIQAGAYKVFTQAADFGNAFGISEFGEEVCLTSSPDGVALGGHRQDEDFGASENGVTFGRHVKSTGRKDFVSTESPTYEGPNSAPLIPDVVISEIMYHPAEGDHEYIELYNRTGDVFPLCDPAHPENPWALTDGVDFVFPPDAHVPANRCALVVEIDPATFRTRYSIPASVPIYGPFQNGTELADEGERITLSYPGEPEWNDPPPGEPPGYVPYIQAEKVTYGAEPPWPTGASGSGQSIHRQSPSDYANDPANWTAGPSTAGSAFGSAYATVVGRHIFYNNSYFDGDPGQGRDDDNAIAPDPASATEPQLGKTVLQPGQTATMVNYTSFSRGINGIMVDIENLADADGLSDVDFDFHASNRDNGPADNTHDPSTWVEAPTPTISVREHAGTGGSHRVTLIWSDRAIRNQWLQVTVKANTTTGLGQNDVFYVGNAVGESLDSAAFTFVDGTDFAGARDNTHDSDARAPIDDRFDYNRDSLVDDSDLAIARDNHTNFLTSLTLFTAPPSGASQSSSPSNSSSSPTSVRTASIRKSSLEQSLANYELVASVAISGSDWPAHHLVDRSYLRPTTRQPADLPQQRTEDSDPRTVSAIFQGPETDGSESPSGSALQPTGDRWLNAVDNYFQNDDGDLCNKRPGVRPCFRFSEAMLPLDHNQRPLKTENRV